MLPGLLNSCVVVVGKLYAHMQVDWPVANQQQWVVLVLQKQKTKVYQIISLSQPGSTPPSDLVDGVVSPFEERGAQQRAGSPPHRCRPVGDWRVKVS